MCNTVFSGYRRPTISILHSSPLPPSPSFQKQTDPVTVMIQNSHCRTRRIGDSRNVDKATREEEQVYACRLLSSSRKKNNSTNRPYSLATFHLMFAARICRSSSDRKTRTRAHSGLSIICRRQPIMLFPLSSTWLNHTGLFPSSSSSTVSEPSSTSLLTSNPDPQGSPLATLLPSRGDMLPLGSEVLSSITSGRSQMLFVGSRGTSPKLLVCRRMCFSGPDPLPRPAPRSRRRPNPSLFAHLADFPSGAVGVHPCGYLPSLRTAACRQQHPLDHSSDA